MPLSLDHFDTVFRFNPSFSYGSALHRQIVDDRKKLGGQLFFDRLLQHLSIQDSHLYPPRTNSELRRLHASITSSPIADHHKLSVLYYILCDCSASSAPASSFHSALGRPTGRGESVSTTQSRLSLSPAISTATLVGQSQGFEYGDDATPRPVANGDHSPAEQFAAMAYIPTQYVNCMRGLWNLDRLYVEAGVEQLVYPTLKPVFFDEILSFLIAYVITNCPLITPTHPHPSSPPRSSLSNLPLHYFHSSPSRPTEFSTQLAYIQYLTLYVGVDAAYSHIRRFPPPKAHQSRILFEKILSDILSHPSLLPHAATLSNSTMASSLNMSMSMSMPHPTSSAIPYPLRSARAVEFINLLLQPHEEAWFESYLSTGEGSSLPNARDMLIMRSLVFGRPFGKLLVSAPVEGGSFLDDSKWGEYSQLADFPAGVATANAFQASMEGL